MVKLFEGTIVAHHVSRISDPHSTVIDLEYPLPPVDVIDGTGEKLCDTSHGIMSINVPGVPELEVGGKLTITYE